MQGWPALSRITFLQWWAALIVIRPASMTTPGLAGATSVASRLWKLEEVALREKPLPKRAGIILVGTPADESQVCRYAAADRTAAIHLLVRAGDPCRRGF